MTTDLSSLICTAVDKTADINDCPTENNSIMLVDTTVDDIIIRIYWKYDSVLDETYFFIQEICKTISGRACVEGISLHFPVELKRTSCLSDAERNEISAVVEHIEF